MKKTCLILVLVLIMNQLNAQNWKPVTANVFFKIKMFGSSVDGKFKGFIGTIKFDANDLKNASIEASVDASTIDTDNNLRNKHLREKEDFFDTQKYALLKIKSVHFEKDGQNFIGVFDLTIKKITKKIKIPFTFVETGDKATFKGGTVINRKDWSIGGGTWGMSDQVNFSVIINAIAN